MTEEPIKKTSSSLQGIKEEKITTAKGPWQTLGNLEVFTNLVRSLNRGKKEIIEQCGFGFLTSYNTKTVKKNMCKWVIDHFNPDTKELTIYGESTVVRPQHVEFLLGFKNRGFHIEEVKHEEERIKKSIFRLLSMDAKDLAKELRKPISNLDEFKLLFTMFVMTCICCPTVDGKPKMEWLHVVAHEKEHIQWNFAAFTLDSTVSAIREFKSSDNPTFLGGCPLLLMTIFCEYSAKNRLDNLWKNDLPRIKDWNDLNIKSLDDAIENLPEGYKTDKLMTVVENDKWKLTGHVPSQHAQIVEKSYHQIMDKFDQIYTDLNFFLKYVKDFVDLEFEDEEEDESFNDLNEGDSLESKDNATKHKHAATRKRKNMSSESDEDEEDYNMNYESKNKKEESTSTQLRK